MLKAKDIYKKLQEGKNEYTLKDSKSKSLFSIIIDNNIIEIYFDKIKDSSVYHRVLLSELDLSGFANYKKNRTKFLQVLSKKITQQINAYLEDK